MSTTLAIIRWRADGLVDRLKELKLDEDADRFEAYCEQFWNDEVSLKEAINDMRAILAQERRLGG